MDMITIPVEHNVGNIIQINIAGQNKSELTSSIILSLAISNLKLIDVSQFDRLGAFYFTALVQLEEDDPDSPALDKLLHLCSEENLECNYHPVIFGKLERQYQHQHDYTAVLLANTISAKTITDTMQFFAEKGFQVRAIQCLSVLTSGSFDNLPVSIEFSLEGSPVDEQLFKLQTLGFSGENKLDLVVRKKVDMGKDYRLAIFDMDSTLIKAEVIDLLADVAGVGKQVAEITEKAMQGKLEFDESFRHRLGMLKGLDESVLRDIAEKLPIMDGAERLMKILRTLGYKTAIVSGGFTYFAQYLQHKLGIDYIYANELEIVNGKVTGDVKGRIINGARKAELLKQLAFREDIELDQVVAVGDGANDLPMLAAAGLGIAFKAKPLVKENAWYAISTVGLDSILFLLEEEDLEQLSLH